MSGVGTAVPASVLLGAGAGVGIRQLLGRLRRGVVLRTGVAEAAGALVTGLGTSLAWGRPTIGLSLLTGLLMIALSAVDIVHHRLPDAITFVALPVSAAAVLVTAWVAPSSGSLLSAAASAAALWALFGAMAEMSSAWMGAGDVKLIPTLGLLMGYLSAPAALIGLTVAFGLGSLVALGGMVAGRLRLGSAIPLGPYLLFGCWSVLLFPALAS